MAARLLAAVGGTRVQARVALPEEEQKYQEKEKEMLASSRHWTDHNSALTKNFQLQSHQVDKSLLTSNAQGMTSHFICSGFLSNPTVKVAVFLLVNS